MKASNYGRCLLQVSSGVSHTLTQLEDEHPCFVHTDQHGTELLWGLTYRMVIRFMEIVTGFIPPDPNALPVYYKHLDKNYMRWR